MRTNSFTVVDIETTGLNPKTDKIIEIGAIRVEQGKVVDSFEQLVNPGRRLEERIVALTGLTDEMLDDAPFIEDVIGRFLSFETTGCLMGHSIIFDYSFLKRAAVNERLVFEREGIDTLAISRKYLVELPSRSLPNLCEHFHINHQAHRALGDVKATYALYQLLTDKFGEDLEAEKVFDAHPLNYQVKREAPVTVKQIEQLRRFLQNYHLESEYVLERMTKSEASRYLDHLIAKHGRLPKR